MTTGIRSSRVQYIEANLKPPTVALGYNRPIVEWRPVETLAVAQARMSPRPCPRPAGIMTAEMWSHEMCVHVPSRGCGT